MIEILPASLVELRNVAEKVTEEVIAPNSSSVDQSASWPSHSMQALADAELLGLHIPKRFGGHEQGLLALAVMGETIGKGCASSALCYCMHCVGSAVIAAKATAYHEEHYLAPIAENKHITTLALSEAGSGVHFYLPQTQLQLDDSSYMINGTKQFVTNGGYANSYVISTQASTPDAEAGDFSCLVLDGDRSGMTWLNAWSGFGMRGNSSRALQMENVKVPRENLLGEEGDQIWYTFEVVAPYFLVAMAATYVGVAQAAMNITLEHLKRRRYAHTGESLSEISVLQHKVAEMNIAIEKARCLLYRAAYLGDLGDPQATMTILMAKADAADTAVSVCNTAMTCCGGWAYRENSKLAQLLRDARASHVMAPTTDVLKVWAGRLLLDLPLV